MFGEVLSSLFTQEGWKEMAGDEITHCKIIWQNRCSYIEV